MNAFYTIKPSYFSNVLENHHFKDIDGKRHMFFIYEHKKELWCIPVSSNYEKYKQWEAHVKSENKKNRFLIFITLFGKNAVLLMNHATPITEEYLDHAVIDKVNDPKGTQLVGLPDPILNLIEKRLKVITVYYQKEYVHLSKNIDKIKHVLYKNKDLDSIRKKIY